MRVRVIPVLLIEDGKLVKTKAFRSPRYVGDPINAIRIFNEKGVDELVVCDISKSRGSRGPDFGILESMASEAFMPMAYSGGVNTMEHGLRLIQLGFEKIGLNSVLGESPELISEFSERFGSQSVVVSVDYKSHWLHGKRQFLNSGTVPLKGGLLGQVQRWVDCGAGEVWLNAFDREGSYAGYDCATIREISTSVMVPVVAMGGCGEHRHMVDAVHAGASAVAAGSMFVFQRPHEAVLISYLKGEIKLDRCQ